MRVRLVAGALLISLVVLSGCSSAGGSGSSGSPGSSAGSGTSGAAAATLVSERCTRCHPVDRIKAANHDLAGWTATVTRMRGKGAQLDDAQAKQVIDFLANGGAGGL